MFNIKDYQECFRFDGYVPLINSYDFVNAYKDLDGVAFFHDGRWYSYISLNGVKKAEKEGMKIYSNKEKYSELKLKTDETYNKIIKIYEKIINGNLNEDNVSLFFSLLEDFRKLYRMTEFFYTDLAFEKMKYDNKIKDNFSDFGDFKMHGRILLNEIFFNNDSFIKKIIDFIAIKLKVDKDIILLLSTNEIVALFHNNKINQKDIQERRKSYFIFAKNNKLNILSGEESLKAISYFISKVENKEIIGRIAYPGIVRGYARVIKVNIENYDKLNEVIIDMKKGEILVAETTEPAIILACKKASAIVTNQGGMMSHAAIVSRELKIPCIVGTNNATEMIKTGNLIEVDADKGVVRIIKRA
jgi:phosphohistidine swiveling domain-containing protein